jgi:hypothetical protein
VPAALLTFYRDPVSWLALAVTSVLLSYVGGLFMFWFHAVELDEGGPAISWYAHWLLDSTFGFIGLTPVLLVVIPLAVAVSTAVVGPARRRPVLAAYVVVAGGLFALATTPGPIAHDLVVGRGTWLADRMTEWIGDPNAALSPVADYPLSAALTQQLGFGVALYLALTALSLLLVRALVGASRRDANAATREAAPAGMEVRS